MLRFRNSIRNEWQEIGCGGLQKHAGQGEGRNEEFEREHRGGFKLGTKRFEVEFQFVSNFPCSI
jgi:hypothetical protein